MHPLSQRQAEPAILRWSVWTGVAACALVVAIGAAIAVSSEPDANADRLATLLRKTARVATLYRDLALKFECAETIEYKTTDRSWAQPTGYVKLSYLYERDAKGQLHDCRMWRKNLTNAGNLRCVSPTEYKIPLYLSNAYSWIFAFLEHRQPWHEYRIIRDETALDRPAVVVEFGPRDVIRTGVNDWYGRAWIDRESYQLLRVEAYRPEYWKQKTGLERARATMRPSDREGPDFEIESIVTEFGETRNGMRFASRVVLRKSRFLWSRDYKEKNVIHVEQGYEQYRFFNVATTATIHGIVNGSEDVGPRP